MIVRAIYSLATLYMMMILLRWVAPHLELDLRTRPFHLVARAVDPLIHKIRRLVPPFGPFDFAPIAALIAVWLARELVLAVFLVR